MPCNAPIPVVNCPGPPAAGAGMYPAAPGICPTCEGKAYVRDRRNSIAGLAANNATALQMQMGWTQRAVGIVERFYTNQFNAAGGAPPCNFAFCITGSGARQEACPYSDLDAFIVLENAVGGGQRQQWTAHSTAVRDLMRAVNHDPGNPLGVGKGFIFCNGGLNPLGLAALVPPVVLTDTAHDLAAILENYFSDPGSQRNQGLGHIVSGLMESSYGFGDVQLYMDFKREVANIMGTSEWKMSSRPHLTRKKRLGMETIQEATTDPHFAPPAANDTRVDVKKQFYRVPQFVLKGLAWYYDLDSVESQMQINQLQARGRLHPTKAQLFRATLATPQRIRVISHLAARAESDHVRTHNDNTPNPNHEYQMTLAETQALLGQLPQIEQIRALSTRFLRQKNKVIGKRTNPFAS